MPIKWPFKWPSFTRPSFKSVVKGSALVTVGAGLALAGIKLLIFLGIQVFGGSPTADKVLAQELFDATFSFSVFGGSLCTGTVIGPHTILTAAHCVWNAGNAGEQTAPISFCIRNQNYKGTCYKANDYRPEAEFPKTGDLAACRMDGDALAGVPYEVVSDSSTLKKGDHVVLVGFGCNPAGDDKLNIGTTEVEDPKSSLNQIVTNAGAISCGGDSGGAVYIEGKDSHGSKVRRVVGVMSSNSKAEHKTRIAALNGATLKLGPYPACGIDANLPEGQKGCRW